MVLALDSDFDLVLDVPTCSPSKLLGLLASLTGLFFSAVPADGFLVGVSRANGGVSLEGGEASSLTGRPVNPSGPVASPV